ncbi:MAG: transporter substrate-binding domain-containing protein [Kiloniellales bacterium]
MPASRSNPTRPSKQPWSDPLIKDRRTSQPFRIGVLFSQSGVTAATEDSMLKATTFAIEEVNAAGGIDGRELIAVHYDPGSLPQNYGRYADRLLSEDGVRVIIGCYMSNARKAVLPIVERRNCLLCYPAQFEGFEYSRNIIYGGAVPNQNSAQLGDYLLEHVGTRFYMVGSDYIWPQESDRIMSEIVTERSGEVVGERYFKMDAPQSAYVPLIKDIKKQQPDVIFCNFVGTNITHFYQAYAEAGLDPKTMPIASLTTSEADILASGVEVGVGHITSAPYFQTVDTDANRRCIERYRKRFGDQEVTNMCWEAAYTQVHLVAEALRQTGSDDIDLLRPAILGREYDAPQGRIRVDPDNGHTYLWPRIGRGRADGLFEIIRQPDYPLKPNPYLISHSTHDWGSKLTSKKPTGA